MRSIKKSRLAVRVGLALFAIASVIFASIVLSKDQLILEVVNWEEGSTESNLDIAFIADLHLDHPDTWPARLSVLFQQIDAHEPQIILFGGDYAHGDQETIDRIRSISSMLGQFTEVLLFAVLGNHEMDKLQWSIELQHAGITVLRNQVVVLPEHALCLRGLGDAYSGSFRYIDFPDECEGSKKLSFLHDPAGAFHPLMRGYVLAGHTHCGQINLPVLGPIWVPSAAPPEAWCGSYTSEQITLHVTSRSRHECSTVADFRTRRMGVGDHLALR